MPKKKSSKTKVEKSAAKSNDEITPDKLIGYFTAAYVLDVAGLLDPAKKSKLDSLRYPGCPSWKEAVEDSYKINPTFVRSVYAVCSELKSPPDAVIFILRGLGCPEHVERLKEVLGG